MDLNFLEVLIDRIFAGIKNNRLGWHLDGQSNVSILKDYDDVVPYLKYARTYMKNDKVEFILNTIKTEALCDNHLKYQYYLKNEGSYSAYVFTDMEGLRNEPWYKHKSQHENEIKKLATLTRSHLKSLSILNGINFKMPFYHLYPELNSRLPFLLDAIDERQTAIQIDAKITKLLKRRVQKLKKHTIFKGLTSALDFKLNHCGLEQTIEFCRMFNPNSYRYFYVYDNISDYILQRGCNNQQIQDLAEFINYDFIENIDIYSFEVIDDLTDWIVFQYKLHLLGLSDKNYHSKGIQGIRRLISLQKQRIVDYSHQKFVKTKFLTLAFKLLIIEEHMSDREINFKLLEDR